MAPPVPWASRAAGLDHPDACRRPARDATTGPATPAGTALLALPSGPGSITSMMRCPFTHPDARLVPAAKAAPDVPVTGRRSAAVAAPVGDINPSWRPGHGTHPPVPDHRSVVFGHRRVRRLGAAGVRHRARHARRLPRAVLPRRPRARRGAAGAVAGLLHLPGAGRLLHRRAVAGRRAAAGRGAGPVRGLLRAPGTGPAGPQFARHGADPVGGLLIAAALFILAIGLITHG